MCIKNKMSDFCCMWPCCSFVRGLIFQLCGSCGTSSYYRTIHGTVCNTHTRYSAERLHLFCMWLADCYILVELNWIWYWSLMTRVYFRPLKKGVVLPLAIVKRGRATPWTYKKGVATPWTYNQSLIKPSGFYRGRFRGGGGQWNFCPPCGPQKSSR